MTSVTQNLLFDYYGLGTERGLNKSLSSHNGSNGLKILKISRTTNHSGQKKGATNDEKSRNEKLEENTEGHMNTEKSEEQEPPRLVRVWNEENLGDEETSCKENKYEMFLESKSIRNNHVLRRVQPYEERNTIEKDHKSASKTSEHELQAPNSVIMEETLPDNASDISSSMPKKRSSKKLMKSPSTPAPRNISNCNGVYLDLTNVGMTVFPVNMLDKLSSLRMLYLENNKLTELPNELFPSLQYLEWLDIRNNELTTVPFTVEGHPCLETILLQGNRVEKLPLELCHVPKLKCLQFMPNPIIFPPKEVIALGCNGVLEFLRTEWNKVNLEKLVELKELGNNNGKYGELTSNPPTILCHKPKSILKCTAKLPLPKVSVKATVSPWATSQVHHKSIREKSWGYKPSNRYAEHDYKMIEQHAFQKKYSAHPCLSTKRICDTRPFSNDGKNLKGVSPLLHGSKYGRKDVKRQSLEQVTNMCLSTKKGVCSVSSTVNLLGASLKSQYVRNNVDISDSCKLRNDQMYWLKSPKVYSRCAKRFEATMGSLKSQMEEVEMEERVFDIVTNDRKMMKLYPMQMDDSQWVLAFLETYLGVAKKWHEY